jgi:hypothetical protein
METIYTNPELPTALRGVSHVTYCAVATSPLRLPRDSGGYSACGTEISVFFALVTQKSALF